MKNKAQLAIYYYIRRTHQNYEWKAKKKSTSEPALGRSNIISVHAIPEQKPEFEWAAIIGR